MKKTNVQLIVIMLHLFPLVTGFGKGFGSKSSISKQSPPKSPPKSPPLDRFGLPPPTTDSIFPRPDPSTIIKTSSALSDAEAVSDFFPSFNVSYPNLTRIHSDPPLFKISSFLAPSECFECISMINSPNSPSSTRMIATPSKTFKHSVSTRTSTSFFLPHAELPTLIEKAVALFQTKSSFFEEPQLVRYEMNQEFTYHYDATPDRSNQRAATLLIYLNTMKEGEGGSTVFRDLDVSCRPVQGDALIFFPSQVTGKVDERTLHSGQKVLGDTEKFVAQLWIHRKEYNSIMF